MQVLPTFSEKMDISLRLAFAYAFMGLLFLLNIVSMQQIFGYGLEIPLVLMAIYYWSIYRPTLLPVWLVFTAGLLYDMFAGFPPGVTAFTLVLLQWVIVDQRAFLMGQTYIMAWLGFLFVAIGAGALQWAIFGLTQLSWPALAPIVFSALLGGLFYPLGSLFFHMIHKVLPAR